MFVRVGPIQNDGQVIILTSVSDSVQILISLFDFQSLWKIKNFWQTNSSEMVYEPVLVDVRLCSIFSVVLIVLQPFIEIRDGLHPCVVTTFSGDEFIPNDLVMSSPTCDDSHRPLVLVTGPNMGGKSTLMRQTALICMLAQMVRWRIYLVFLSFNSFCILFILRSVVTYFVLAVIWLLCGSLYCCRVLVK